MTMKRKTTSDTATSVAALASEVQQARGRLEVLDAESVAALITAPSDDELRLARDNAEHSRTRQLQAQRDQLDSQLASQDSLRRAQTEILELDIRDVVDARKAIAQQRRTDDAAARLARVHRYSVRTPQVYGVVIAIGMIWSAINVQQNMAPGGPSDPMFWASFLIEGMISGALVMLAMGSNMVQETAGMGPDANQKWGEAGLLAFTLALNVYPYVRDSHWYDAALHAVAPVMIGIALWLMHAQGKRYATARARIVAESPTLEAALPDLPTMTVQPVAATVHPSAQTVHSAGQPDSGATESVAGDRPATETVHPAEATVHPAEATVHPTASTVQETVHPVEVDRAPSTATAYGSAETVHPIEVTVQPTVQTVQATVETVHGDRAPVIEADVDTAEEPVETVAAEEIAVAEDTAFEVDQHENGDKSDRTVGDDVLAGIHEAARAHRQDRQTTAPTVRPIVRGSELPQWWPQQGAQSDLDTVQATVQPTVQTEPTVHEVTATVQDTVQTVHHDSAETVQHSANTEQQVHGWVDNRGDVPAEFVELGAAVHGRLTRTKFSVGDIAQALWLHRAHRHNPDRIYRDKGPHRSQSAKWIGIAEQIDAERATAEIDSEGELASVITLRKG